MNKRELNAWIDRRLVGTLREKNGLWSFRYEASWLEHPGSYPLSPHLPLQGEAHVDGASLRQVQWYFDNLLPEEGQRELLAADAKVDVADAFGLLAYYGAESAGSVTLLPPGQEERGRHENKPLGDGALSERIRALPQVPLNRASPKRMSLAGAQHKLPVTFQQQVLSEPVGPAPSTHILKPEHPHPDYPHSVTNEWFVSKLAGRIGLEVPNVWRRYVPEPVFIIERFDRFLDAGDWRRRHVIDACQLLGIDRTYKYNQGGIDRLSELAGVCRSPAVARTRLYSWLVFNVLTGNTDAHLKNLSFTVTSDGIQPAPHYDLLSIAVYDTPAFDHSAWPERTELSWPILGRVRYSQINREVMLEAGEALGLAATTAARLLDQQCARILDTAEALLTETETENTGLARQRPELGPTLAGEARCLRAIVRLIVRDVVEGLIHG